VTNGAEVSLRFLGKWVWTSGNDSVQLDATTGALVVGAEPGDGAHRFNAYGTLESFTLQASNGKFVALKGTAYVADRSATDPVNRFTLSGDRPAAHVVDLGPPGATSPHQLWNRNGTAIAPIAASVAPPETAQIVTTVVTEGIDALLEGGVSSPDLSWAILRGVDFGSAPSVDFNTADLRHTDFTGSEIPPGTPFHHADASAADFTDAVLEDCDLGSATLTSADFTRAKMAGADLSGAVLTGATLTDADLRNTANLAQARFDGATLIRTDLRDAPNIFETSFANAKLNGARFDGASVTGWMDLTGADCTDVRLFNPPDATTVFPNCVRVDAKTNFHGAQLRYLDFTGYDLADVNFAHADLTGCKLDGAALDRTNFGFATLDRATFTGGISMHGANLANSSLRGADLTGAQLGAVTQLFRVGDDSRDHGVFLAALRTSDVAGVGAVFDRNKRPLSGTVSVRAMVFAPDTAWQVQDAAHLYLVFLEPVGAGKSLVVYEPSAPAVLANAFMVDVNLKSANLFGVRASGAQLYATAGGKVNLNKANINGLQANNANLGGIDLSEAYLAGCNFDYAVLTGAKFIGATLTVDANGGQPSFNGANLQGAKFDKAILKDVIFANAAVAVARPGNPTAVAGVWLFDLSAEQAELLVPQLQAASVDPAAKPGDPQHVFTAPTELLATMDATGPVPKGLRAAFKAASLTLADSALLVVLTTELFWLVGTGRTQSAVFRSVDRQYRPALGVSTDGEYTVDADFYLPLSVEASLRNGPATISVVEAFKAAGHPLAAGATVTTSQHPVVWQVVSGTDTYTLGIAFDSTIAGVDTKITVRPSIPNVISTFGQVSIALSNQSVITRLDGGGWKVDNDAGNPFNPARGYIEFTVLPTAQGGLDVYGSLIRIVRATGQGAQEFTNIPCEITRLTVDELAGSGTTVCPNGATVTANQGDRLPFARWMSARYLPRPPVCVPDPQGKFFCPT
jgi:uncharacterized protein YjbI with pentapeptide repeats